MDVQDLKPGEVLVRILYSGVCHTDLHAYKGDWPMANKVRGQTTQIIHQLYIYPLHSRLPNAYITHRSPS